MVRGLCRPQATSRRSAFTMALLWRASGLWRNRRGQRGPTHGIPGRQSEERGLMGFCFSNGIRTQDFSISSSLHTSSVNPIPRRKRAGCLSCIPSYALTFSPPVQPGGATLNNNNNSTYRKHWPFKAAARSRLTAGASKVLYNSEQFNLEEGKPSRSLEISG